MLSQDDRKIKRSAICCNLYNASEANQINTKKKAVIDPGGVKRAIFVWNYHGLVARQEVAA